jgi:hypothetical protein
MSANIFGFSVSVKTNLREQVKPHCGGRNQNEYGYAMYAAMKIRIGDWGLKSRIQDSGFWISAARYPLLAGQARGAL